MTAYTGYLTRRGHYSRAGDVAPGIDSEHTHPDPEPDPFDNKVTVPAGQSGDVWNATEAGFQSGFDVERTAHWFNGHPSVPSNVPYGVAQQEMQNRMLEDHGFIHYRPDSIRLYQHATEGEQISYEVGRMPQNAGQTVSDDVAYLVMGTNSYDQTNQPNEVYQGDPANVGRYRLGARYYMAGLYDNPHGKFGLDTMLRAYTGLTPQFPEAKNQPVDSPPHRPNSSGPITWVLPQFQIPRLFALPSETVMTDYTTAAEQTAPVSDFYDDGRL